ncbi:MAG: signal peptidase II [Acholeplasmataceae bacterium]|nr:signal peptidase II [Acholeplasmataceae bacterium]
MLIGSIIIIFSILIDQVTKQLAQAYIPQILSEQQSNIVLIPKLIELSYHQNTGASFNIFDGAQIFFMLITIVALAIFGYLFLDVNFKTKKVYSIAISLFIGGTLGNAIDRALFGYVIDFLHFPFLTPVLDLVNISNFYNNFADIFLSAAIVLFAIDLFILDPKRKKKEKQNVSINQDQS